jgi:uncharacterized membrane protein YedE/YeeE
VLLSRRLAKPILAEDFSLPAKTRIDRPLITGSAIFGIGWGLAGFCPGPALSAFALGLTPVVLFVCAMIAGMLVHDRLYAKQP